MALDQGVRDCDGVEVEARSALCCLVREEDEWVADEAGDEVEVDEELDDGAVRFRIWGGTYAPGIFARASRCIGVLICDSVYSERER